jgi:8-oxo-dGTP pyrophosphatase MutT (NUDIX family)
MNRTNKKTIFCSNCGNYGHYLKNCLAPITSFGCIVIKLPKGFDQSYELLKNDNSVSGFENYMKDIKFLMIQRRDSLGFIEIIRGKYKTNNKDYIQYHIDTMTNQEHQKLLTQDFDSLWNGLWGTPKEQTQAYKNDKESARLKFEQLKAGSDELEMPSLEYFIANSQKKYNVPEWGFPKGRRDSGETDLQCALRELREETGVIEKDVIFIRNLDSISETFFGSNHIHYCHKYFMFLYNSDKELAYDPSNFHMVQEIGDLGWFSLEECLNNIRPENIEKKEVLLRASSLLRNYCPLKTF